MTLHDQAKRLAESMRDYGVPLPARNTLAALIEALAEKHAEDTLAKIRVLP